MNSVSKNIMELMKVIATNQMKLAKKVDLMNKRFKQFLAEATTTSPLDFNSLSVKEEPVEDFSNFSIDSNPKSSTEKLSSGVRTISSRNTDPFDPTWTSQKEVLQKEEETLPKGVTRTKSSAEMFPEVVGIDEQVKQLEAEMAALDMKSPKKPKTAKKALPSMDELAAKMRSEQLKTALPPVTKTRTKKIKKDTTKVTTPSTDESVPPPN